MHLSIVLSISFLVHYLFFEHLLRISMMDKENRYHCHFYSYALALVVRVVELIIMIKLSLIATEAMNLITGSNFN